MAAPTNTYCDYAAGNDYKGATFTDGAYTSGTKTLTKAGAFAASQVNHWLYLSSNAGGSIVTGYYKIASIAGAPNAVVLATDAGGGVDATDAKCTQAAGTLLLPWRSIQGALDLITRDATNGDQINVKAGTAQVNQAALTLARYGTPGESSPLILRGYTTSANDGGMGEVDCNGVAMFTATYNHIYLGWLHCHTFGDNNGIVVGTNSAIIHCEVDKGASTPSGKYLISGGSTQIVGCYVHDSGATGRGINNGFVAYMNYVYNCPTGIAAIYWASRNIVVDCATGILLTTDWHNAIENTVYSSTANTGTGISASAGVTPGVVVNNIIEGYSGSGGKGIAIASDLVILGYNGFYNNSTPESLADTFFDLGNDATLASSPFTNAAGGDFSLNTAVSGAIDGAFPGAWYGPASTTDHADIGAVQNGAGAGGAVSISPLRGGF